MSDALINPYVLAPELFPSASRASVLAEVVKVEPVEHEPAADLTTEALATLLSDAERMGFGYKYDDWLGLSWRAEAAERNDLRDHIRHTILGLEADGFADDNR